MSKDAHREVCRYVMRLIDYGKGGPDPELDGLTIAEIADQIIAVALKERIPDDST